MNEITSRYATALYSLKLDSQQLLESQKEVRELKNIFLENPDFIVILSSSYKSSEEKVEIIDKTLVGVDDEIKSWIKIIAQNHRASQLVDIFDGFISLVNEYRGVKEGLVYSTEKLSEAQLTKLNKKISEVENIPVDLKNIIDPSLIGGVKVVINDHIYDGSIKHHIEDMKISLLK